MQAHKLTGEINITRKNATCLLIVDQDYTFTMKKGYTWCGLEVLFEYCGYGKNFFYSNMS